MFKWSYVYKFYKRKTFKQQIKTAAFFYSDFLSLPVFPVLVLGVALGVSCIGFNGVWVGDRLSVGYMGCMFVVS